MRKVMAIFFTIGISIGLIACSNEPSEVIRTDMLEEEVPVKSNTSEDNSDQTPEKESDNDEQELNEADESNDENKAMNIDIIDFEEAHVIENEVDISDLDVQIETNNRNNRVILFMKDNDPVYKTVYLKHDKRLKIISIYENSGQIFNEIIDR